MVQNQWFNTKHHRNYMESKFSLFVLDTDDALIKRTLFILYSTCQLISVSYDQYYPLQTIILLARQKMCLLPVKNEVKWFFDNQNELRQL